MTRHNSDKPKVQRQGRIVIERDSEFGDYLLMSPDGSVTYAKTKRIAEAKARAWFKENVESGKIGLGIIEWR